MKEYALFVKENGDVEAFCGGQFARGAYGDDLVSNVAKLWKALDEADERLMEFRDTGIDDRSGERTFVVKTLPKQTPKPEPENCSIGSCKHPKNFAGSCIVYLMEHPIQCDQRRR